MRRYGERMRKTFKYRLYPSKAQEKTLDYWLYLCRRLYNTCLEQRQIAGQMGHRVSKFDQMKELPLLKAEFPEYAQIGSHVLQDVCKRLDKSFERFFNGAGYPRFQGRNRYDSFTFPDQAGWKLKDGRLYITNMGAVKVKWSRPIEGTIKTVTIKRRAGQWFVCFSCDDVPAPVYGERLPAVGIDLGLEALVTTSDGERYENHRYLKGKLKQLRRIQRHMARQKKGSKRREKTKLQVQRLHLKIANQRTDHNHKVSTALVRQYVEIHHEDISPKFMIHNKRLAQAAHDAAWGQLLSFTQSKAATAGGKTVAKNPFRTSQECHVCGELVPKPLSQRWHICPKCGTKEHRDTNAAKVILKRPA